MILYAESSAVLAWLLGEPDGSAVRKVLADADAVIASDLTLIECDRVLHRAVAGGLLTEADALDRRRALNRAARHWHRLGIDTDVVERARRVFPVEPVRTLDALHLASALRSRGAVTDLGVLSLDQRIRTNAKALGLDILPRSAD